MSNKRLTRRRQRLEAQERREKILTHATHMIGNGDYADVNARVLGEQLGIAPSLIAYHFGSIQALRDEAIAAGVRRRDARAILIGLHTGHPDAIGLSDAAKKRAISEY